MALPGFEPHGVFLAGGLALSIEDLVEVKESLAGLGEGCEASVITDALEDWDWVESSNGKGPPAEAEAGPMINELLGMKWKEKRTMWEVLTVSAEI